jgi:hypothetical protein
LATLLSQYPRRMKDTLLYKHSHSWYSSNIQLFVSVYLFILFCILFLSLNSSINIVCTLYVSAVLLVYTKCYVINQAEVTRKFYTWHLPFIAGLTAPQCYQLQLPYATMRYRQLLPSEWILPLMVCMFGWNLVLPLHTKCLDPIIFFLFYWSVCEWNFNMFCIVFCCVKLFLFVCVEKVLWLFLIISRCVYRWPIFYAENH